MKGLTWRVDGINGGHRESSLNGTQRRNGILRQVGQTDGQHVRLGQLELCLQAHSEGGTRIAQLGECVLTIRDHAHLQCEWDKVGAIVQGVGD